MQVLARVAGHELSRALYARGVSSLLTTLVGMDTCVDENNIIDHRRYH